MSSIVRAHGLTKRYPGVTALDAVDLDLPAGRVGLLGANGARKTALFRLLLGLNRLANGRRLTLVSSNE